MTMNPKVNLTAVSTVVVMMVLAALVGYAIVDSPDQPYEGGLLTFNSKSELVEFLGHRGGGSGGPALTRLPFGSSEQMADAGGGAQYSETNVQTAGVDEADVIKTDGEYAYIAVQSGVKIVSAVPADDMQIVSILQKSEIFDVDDENFSSVEGLFIEDDKLVVLGSVYPKYTWYRYVQESDNYQYEPPRVVVSVFDVSDRSNPSRESIIGISGSSLTSRMVGDVVYVLTHTSIWYVDEDNILPRVWKEDGAKEVALSSIRYDPETRYADSLVNMLAFDISNGDDETLSVVAGWASTIYMSTDAIYFAVQKWVGDIEQDDGFAVPERMSSARTTIYKIAVEGTDMSASANGGVKGWLLNQFSMDQKGEHLRVATTTSWVDSENAVYVLDGDMQVVGALEGLAPTERIYSARFIGDTLYLVTFRQVDPLFVIDLSDPTKPKVAGELKIPGFSTYLHPVDDSHVLGIGQEDGRIKVSLFDVSDPTKPVEQSKIVVEGLFSSAALYDHKAVLFDLDRELLVIPGCKYVTYWSNWTDGYYSYGYYSRSDAYVFEVSLSDGLSIRGVVEHEIDQGPYYNAMTRALYIGDYLYTLSTFVLQANSLEDLSFAGKVVIDEASGGWGYYEL